MNKKILTIASLLASFLTLFGQDEEYILQKFEDHKGAVLSVALSPDGKYLLSGGEDKTLMIYTMADYEEAYKYEDNYFAPRALVVTQVNNIFMGSGSDVKLIDLENKTLAVYKGNSTHIWSVAYAPERNKIAAGSYDYKLKVWDVSTQELELQLEGHKKSTLPVAFSPDEKYIVSGSLDRSVKIWNAKTGAVMQTLERHSDNIYDIAFHPSGRYFASSSLDKTIRLWDFESGEVMMTYVGHDHGILDIEFLPDGNHFLSASFDGSIRLWEAKTGRMVYTYAGHEGVVNSIDVNSEGTQFASGGADGKVFLWELSQKVFVEFAYYDEFNAEKESISLFNERRKSESRSDYEKRTEKAAQREKEIVARYYKMYIEELRKKQF